MMIVVGTYILSDMCSFALFIFVIFILFSIPGKQKIVKLEKNTVENKL